MLFVIRSISDVSSSLALDLSSIVVADSSGEELHELLWSFYDRQGLFIPT